jgi:amidase
MDSIDCGSSRRRFLQAALTAGGTAALYPALGAGRVAAVAATRATPEVKASEAKPFELKPFELDESTIPELQDGMKSGKFTARSLTEKYLERIDDIDKQGPAVNAIIELNPDALAIADALDQEHRAKGPRGALHGIPVLIKDNIDTADRMMTTAGSLALVGSKPPKDSFVAQKLRAAGCGHSGQDQSE